MTELCAQALCNKNAVHNQNFCPEHLNEILLSMPTISKKDTNPKDAIGIKKPCLTTIPFPVLYEIGAAMLEGACKYRRHNYRVAGVRVSVYIEAAFRHLAAFWEGEDIDPDSGLSHISKAMASLVVLRDAMMSDMAQDDRPPSPKSDWMDDIQKHVDEVLARYDGKEGRPSPLPPYIKDGPIQSPLGDDRGTP